jgi:chemotaxis-related protein WspD
MKKTDHQLTAAGRDSSRSGHDDAMRRLLDRPLSEEDIRRATERVAQPRARPVRDVASLLLFRVGAERLAVRAVEVARVSRVAVVRRIPHRSNQIIRGLCNADGELLICGDLSALLDLTGTSQVSAAESGSSDLRRMVVLGPESNRWAIEVDEVLGVQEFETASYKRPPVTVQKTMYRFTANLLSLGGDDVATLLDVSQVLSGFRVALS